MAPGVHEIICRGDAARVFTFSFVAVLGFATAQIINVPRIAKQTEIIFHSKERALCMLVAALVVDGGPSATANVKEMLKTVSNLLGCDI